jgi:hypothetical protein
VEKTEIAFQGLKSGGKKWRNSTENCRWWEKMGKQFTVYASKSPIPVFNLDFSGLKLPGGMTSSEW